jgi:plastocyanin
MAAPVTRRTAIVGAVATATVTALATTHLSADQPTVYDVKIKRFKFDPEVLEVKVGDIIRWANEDLAPHTATANEFGWDTGEIAKGVGVEVTVVEGMDTSYFCAFHPHMTASFEIS